MAEYRKVYTNIWEGEWLSSLSPEGKVLYIYLLTNHRASVAGIYEISERVLAFGTGLDSVVITRLLGEFRDSKKIMYEGGVIWVFNMREYQESQSPTVQKCILKDFMNVADGAVKTAYAIQYGYSIDTVSKPDNTVSRPDNTVSIPTPTRLDETRRDETRRDDAPARQVVQPADPASAFVSHHITKAYIDTYLPGQTIPNGERTNAWKSIQSLERHPQYTTYFGTYELAREAFKWWNEHRRRDSERKPLQYIVPGLIDEIKKHCQERAA